MTSTTLLQLTGEELTLLSLYANGNDKEQVREKLGISAAALRNRTTNMCNKLGADNVTHAVAIAFCAHILQPPMIDGFRLPEPGTPKRTP